MLNDDFDMHAPNLYSKVRNMQYAWFEKKNKNIDTSPIEHSTNMHNGGENTNTVYYWFEYNQMEQYKE